MTRRLIERKKKIGLLQGEAHGVVPPSSSSLEAQANSGPASSTISVEPSQVVEKPQNDFSMNSDELSLLSHAELISKLKKAHAKIKELSKMLESGVSKSVTEAPPQHENSQVIASNNNPQNQTDPGFPRNYDILRVEGDGENPKFDDHNAEELMVAFEYNGSFLDCDDDLELDDENQVSPEEDNYQNKVQISELTWDSEYDGEVSKGQDFPLIPSPLLNTPPYEYLFLTKENEAKLRIFLNPKLDKVFHEELLKLQKQDELQSTVGSQELDQASSATSNPQGKTLMQPTHLDLHNQNHLMNTSITSGHDVTETSSGANVINCFDPSDVDLELKKVFMDKPPLTHRIVRRKSRKERGSSVPGIDSYYGTKDLSKVGHASYFIPNLTESERKAIGWKTEYHYGHWKYATFNVPDIITNPISLHPHPHPEEECGDHYKNVPHHHHHTATHLSENPLHQKDINLSEPYVTSNDNETLSEKTNSPQHIHHHHRPTCKYYHDEDSCEEGTLSFITLSGTSQNPTPSCHIIPDKSTLRKILKWIMPSCVKPSVTSQISLTGDGDGDMFFKEKIPHEIETLVKPTSNMEFHQSHTQFSLEASGIKLPNHHHLHEQSSISPNNQSENQSKQHHPEHSQNHSHHHHHHGFFHWKNILSHGTSSSTESMSAVGGDVLESCHNIAGASALQMMDIIHIDEDNKPCPEESIVIQEISDLEESSTEDSDNEPGGSLDQPKRKLRTTKRLKPSKAFTRLLTLKDLGYEIEKLDCELQKKIALGAAAGEGEMRQIMKV